MKIRFYYYVGKQQRSANAVKSEDKKNTGTFVLNILNRQNSTWQGKITWIEKQRSENFRSALELLKLIDNALDENTEE